MSAQSSIPGVKTRWPWAFAITVVPTVLATPVLWQQKEKIEQLRSVNADMQYKNQTLQSASEKLDTELRELRKQKGALEERVEAEAETSRKEAQKLQSELKIARANARILVTKPLDAKVQSLGFFDPDPWKIDWTLMLTNASSQPISVHVKLYCLAPDENSFGLNEWRILEPVVIDAEKDRFFSQSVKIEKQHCRARGTFMIVPFAEMPGGVQVPLDLWRFGKK